MLDFPYDTSIEYAGSTITAQTRSAGTYTAP